MATLYKRENSQFWWAKFTNGSQVVRKSTGETDRRAAERKLKEFTTQQETEIFCFVKAWVYFCQTARVSESTLRTYKTMMKKTLSFLINVPVSEVNPRLLNRIVHSCREQGLSDWSIRLRLAFIRTVMSTAMEHPNAPQHNPIAGYKLRLGTPERRVRFLERSEFQRLIDACSSDMHRNIVTLAVNTGMRRGEIQRLTWEKHISMDRREILLFPEDTKTSKMRVVPLNQLAVNTLASTPRSGAYVFWHSRGQPYKDFSSWFTAAVERAGLSDVRFHDLRRTFASWWLQDGGDWEILRQILGHRQGEMTDSYGRYRTQDLHRGVTHLEVQREITSM